jgi:predicted amidohydrolase YtcJ
MRGVQAGLDLWVHAIGDRAITRVLDVFAGLRQAGYREQIFRIEHVQHLDPGDLARFAELGVIASMQPIHQPSDMHIVDAYLGPRRARWSYAFRSLLAARATLAFGSDCPVEPLEPLPGIYSAVTRQDRQGRPYSGWYPEERISIPEAVRAFTTGAAESVGDSARAGALAPGKRSDAIVLSQDIFALPPECLPETRIDLTVAGGQVVHRAPD